MRQQNKVLCFTVGPFFEDHPKNQAEVVVKGRWPLARAYLHGNVKGKASGTVVSKEGGPLIRVVFH